jgi:CxxC motif-containing protein
MKTITHENPGAKRLAVDLSDMLEKIEQRTPIKINDDLKKKMGEFKLTNDSTHQRDYKRSPI